MPLEVAAFDVDGTLTRRDSFLPFLNRVAGPARVGATIARHSRRFALVASGRGDRDQVKAAVVRSLLAGRHRAELEQHGRQHAAAMLRRTRPDTMARLRWHRQEGHAVVLVSASLHCYLEPFATALGADALLCTDLAYDDDGRCTGELLGANCRGQEKATRLLAWIGATPDSLWAYGDSAGDDHLLAMAKYAHRVNRSRLPAIVVQPS